MSLSATDLGTLGGRESAAHAVNDRGQIVGSATTKKGYPHAVVWHNGEIRDLGTLSGVASRATDINNRGQIVGSFDVNVGNLHYPHAFVWQKRSMQALDRALEADSVAWAINDRGQIVGTWDHRPALWENRALRLLPTPPGATGEGDALDINDRGEIVGVVRANNQRRAVLWHRGKMQYLGQADVFGSALAINDRGQIAGSVVKANGKCNGLATTHAVLWQEGKIRDLGVLGGDFSVATAINNQGQVLGAGHEKCARYSYEATSLAFLWAHGQIRNLGELGGAEAINDDGAIVGSFPVQLCSDARPACSVTHAFLWMEQEPRTGG